MIISLISLTVLSVFFITGFFLGKSTGFHKGRIFQIEQQLDRDFKLTNFKKTKW